MHTCNPSLWMWGDRLLKQPPVSNVAGASAVVKQTLALFNPSYTLVTWGMGYVHMYVCVRVRACLHVCVHVRVREHVCVCKRENISVCLSCWVRRETVCLEKPPAIRLHSLSLLLADTHPGQVLHQNCCDRRQCEVVGGWKKTSKKEENGCEKERWRE